MFFLYISITDLAAVFCYSLLVTDMIYNFNNNTCNLRTMQGNGYWFLSPFASLANLNIKFLAL